MNAENNNIISEFEKLDIRIERDTLPDESWISILNTLKSLFTKYPEISKGVLGTIRAIQPEYKFLYSIGYDYDPKSQTYASASGMTLELSKARFEDPKYIKDIMAGQGLLLELDQVIPYVIAQAFSHVLFINMGLLSGQLDPETIKKADYDKYTSAEEYLNRIKENARKRMLAEEEEDIADVSALRLFADAVAGDLAGKESKKTKYILQEYHSLMVKEE